MIIVVVAVTLTGVDGININNIVQIIKMKIMVY